MTGGGLGFLAYTNPLNGLPLLQMDKQAIFKIQDGAPE
jgi:hypothetical protein